MGVRCETDDGVSTGCYKCTLESNPCSERSHSEREDKAAKQKYRFNTQMMLLLLTTGKEKKRVLVMNKGADFVFDTQLHTLPRSLQRPLDARRQREKGRHKLVHVTPIRLHAGKLWNPLKHCAEQGAALNNRNGPNLQRFINPE